MPLSSLSVLSTLLSFLFISPPFRISSAPSCTHSIYSPHTLPFSSNFSSALFLSGRRAPSPALFGIPQVSPGGFGAAREGGGQHLISYLRINHEVLSAQSRSDPSAGPSASAGSLLPAPLPIDKWQPEHLTQTYFRHVTTALTLFHIQPLYNTPESISIIRYIVNN